MIFNGVALTTLASIVITGVSSEIIGVHPSRQHLYEPTIVNGEQVWKCLGDPSIVLDYSQINDDFCDCPDGSDEPGTNACPYSADREPFYCENKGHISGYIDHFKLNDGVCDYEYCCDGSDEYANESLCPNKCKEIHDQFEKYKQNSKDEIQKSLDVKKQLVQESTDVRENLEKSALILKNVLAEDEKTLLELKSRLENLVVDSPETEVDEEQGHINFDPQFEKLSSYIQSQKQIIDKQKEKAQKLAAMLENLVNNYNPNFNDAAVKEAVRNYQNFASNDDDTEDQLESQIHEDADSVLNELREQVQIQPPVASTSPTQAPLIVVPSFQNMVHYYYDRVINNFLNAPKPPSDKQESPSKEKNSKPTKRVNSEEASILSADISGIELEINAKKAELSIVEEDLQTNYGEQDILRSVRGKWVANKLGEYRYNLGFFEAIYQEGHGNNVLIGKFSSIDANNRLVYQRGEKCWNGPHRSAVVELLCGPTTKLLSVSEPEKCEYYFQLMTPIVCQETSEDELISGFKIDYDKL
ncbi:hypothetical protein CAAN3_08S03334 [[Candida] anglica]